jgi:acyl-CoA thioesterase-1
MKSAIAMALVSSAGLMTRAAAGAPRTPTRVACVGDSITAGALASSPSKNYVSDLQRLFDAGAQVGQFGHGGATMLATGDIPYTRQEEYAAATAFVANAGADSVVDVVIMLGTNDSKPWNWGPDGGDTAKRFAADCAAMIDHFATLPTHPVVYLALPPAAFPNSFGIRGNVIHDEIIPILDRVARQKGAPVIDVNTPTAALPDDFVDAVHPGDTGYELIAQLIYRGLLVDSAAAPVAPASSSARSGCSGCAMSATESETIGPWLAAIALCCLRRARRREAARGARPELRSEGRIAHAVAPGLDVAGEASASCDRRCRRSPERG